MKVFVQVPCLNEEATLPAVLGSIPKSIPGVDELHVLVIDDGSTDRTVEVARAHGVTHFVHHVRNQGLARSFRDGVHYALSQGADIVVNTDGDNQYPQSSIPELLAPLLAGDADIAIGDRQTHLIEHFSPFKKRMQRFGSKVVNMAAETDLPDAASGFRAYSRSALIKLNIVTQFSYCMETIIQAGNKRMKIASVPVTTNPKTRESRLFSSMGEHMLQSGKAIARSYFMFKPFAFFVWLGIFFGVVGLIPFVRYAILLETDSGGNHLQSLMLGIFLLVAAALSFALAVMADLLRTNRVLLEESLEQLKELRYAAIRHEERSEASETVS